MKIKSITAIDADRHLRVELEDGSVSYMRYDNLSESMRGLNYNPADSYDGHECELPSDAYYPNGQMRCGTYKCTICGQKLTIQ